MGLLVVCLGLFGPEARAQRVLGPGDQRPKLEPFAPESQETPLELPVLPPAEEEEAGEMAVGIAVEVREFVVEGSTVFSAEQLARVTRPYTGRAITSEELLAARDAVTQLYIESGYITSGAVVPDQAFVDGVLVIQVLEGRIADVVVDGVHWFRPSYFHDRLLRAGRTPVSVTRLEEVLRLLQQDPLIEQLNARLEPGDRRGESVLYVSVVEGLPIASSASVANDHNPNVGSIGGEFGASFANLLGHADRLSVEYQVTEGLWDYELRYELPLNSYDTLFGISWHDSKTDIIDDNFKALDIESQAWTAAIELRHPILRSPELELWVGVIGERRKSWTSVLGQPFSFIGESPKQDTSVLRFEQDFTWRSTHDVVTLRSTTSLGFDVLSATDAGEPDSQFVSWLLQGQWAHRLPAALLQSQLLMRVDFQLANDPLPVLERLAMGGQGTVRGYRHNSVVRDNGVISSAELRVPILQDSLGRDLVQLSPFIDVGRAWDDQGEFGSETLVGMGLGLRVFPWDGVQGEIYWGENLTDAQRTGERDLQDDGVYFRVTVQPFEALGDLW